MSLKYRFTKNRFTAVLASNPQRLSCGHEFFSLGRQSIILGIVAGLLGVCAVTHAQQTVVANFSGSSLTIVDLVTGNRTVLSSATVGAGTTFSSPVGTAREANGNILVGEQNNPSKLFRIDPLTGNRTVVSDSVGSIGTGPALGFVYGLAVEADGNILAAVSSVQAIYRINPTTGNRTVVTSTTIGSGATMRNPFGLVLDPDGSIVFVPWNSASEVIRVNPSTGARTVISSATVGTGPALSNPPGIVRMSDGAYAVINNSATDYVLRVDPTTGNRTVISSSTVGTGPTIGLRYSIAQDISGNLYVADFAASSIVKIDPATGNRTTVSSAVVGTGTNLSSPLGMLGGAVASISSTPPTVTTTAATSIATTSATLAGNVTSAGSATVTATGVVWSVTVTNATPTVGGTGVTNVTIGSGTGAFSQSVTSLPSGTALSFRAYATSSAGTSYGSVLTFTTVAANSAPTDIALSNSSVNQTSGANATVGTLSSTDSDSSTFTYSFTSGAGSTDNASFSLSGATLRANDASALAGGTYSVRVQTDDGSGGTFAKNFTLTVVDNIAPIVTSAASASATYKTAFGGYTIVATGGATSYGATGLPTGLSVNAATGVISGTPTQSGSFSVTLNATDAAANPGNATLTLSVAKLPLTVTGVIALNKTYNASSAATLSTASAVLSGIATGDTVTLSTGSAIGTFSNATVGPGKIVTVAGLALSGADSANYTLTQPATTASITPATVTVTGITASNKAYDASIAATLNTASAAPIGIVSGDTVTLSAASASGSFADAAIGTSKVVTIAGLALTGADSGNYTLTQPTTTANITQATATVVFGPLSFTYDGSAHAVTTVTTPSSLTVTLTYDGAATAPSNAGTYTVAAVITASNYAGSASGTLTIVPAAQTISFASPGNVNTGSPVTLSATASSGLPVVFSVVSGNASVSGTSLTIVDNALVTVRATQSGSGNYLSATADLALTATTLRTDRLINLSSRARVSPVANRRLITGFVIGGTASKRVLLRAIGPALTPFGVQGVLSNPRLQLYDASGKMILENDDWSGTDTAATFAQVGAFSLPVGSRDAALVTTLAPGAYTMHIFDGAETGIALAEIYDASLDPAEYQRLVNISSRGTVDSADGVLIGGFVIAGNNPKKVLIRGIGPALTAYGVSEVLTDPRLAIFSGNTLIAQNDDWASPQQVAGSSQLPATADEIASATQATGAFALAVGTKDSAVIVTLAPGAYTAQVSSANAQTGGAMVEIYEMP